MEAAADDLGVELLRFEFEAEDRFAKITEGVQILRNTPHIDGAIFSVAFGQARPLLEETERQGIPVLLQGPLFDSEIAELGLDPRRRYDSWVGLFEQDERTKGYMLGRLLLREAADRNLRNEDGHLQVVGLGGDPSWQGSRERADGLRQAVSEFDVALLSQIVDTNWTVTDAKRLTRGLLARYPRAAVVWTASDQLAIGASEVLRETGRTIGEDVVVGGLDLSPEGLRDVLSGRITATVSSWLLSYAEMLIYLYDYLNGFDFAPEQGTEIVLDVHSATMENAHTFLEIYSSLSEVQFKLFSKAHNPSLDKYDFSVAAFQSAMAQ